MAAHKPVLAYLSVLCVAFAGGVQGCHNTSRRLPAQRPTETPPVEVREARPGLLLRAGIRPDSAASIARDHIAGADVLTARIEETGGRLAYVFSIRSAGHESREIVVDAMTGLRRAGPATGTTSSTPDSIPQ